MANGTSRGSALHEKVTRVLEPTPVKRQKYKRYPVNIQVTRYDGDTVYWQSVNLSLGGVFVSGPPFLPVGEELEIGLWLTMDTGDGELVTRARVNWLNHPDEPRDNGLPAGMGLEFLELDADDRNELREFLRAQASAARSPGPPVSPVPTGHEQGSGTFRGDPSALTTNDVLGSHRVLRRLGSGGMGSVYIAEHQSLGRKVALKTLHHKFAHDASVVRRFFDEARVVNQINHENIIEITDFVSTNNLHYFVMELLEGRNLSEAQAEDGQFSLKRILAIGVQLCSALQAAHDAGVTHRDLKPDNIILTERAGNPDFVKLLDFGIAKLSEHQGSMNQTSTGMVLGTPGYMAPEQIVEGKTDHRADIYAFGVLLYQMVTGKKPFVADTWPQMVHKQTTETPPRPGSAMPGRVPRRLENVIMSCLERSPDDRPQTMRAIGQELGSIAVTLEITLPGHRTETDTLPFVELEELTPEPRGRGFLRIAVGGGALLVALAIGGAVALDQIPSTASQEAPMAEASGMVGEVAAVNTPAPDLKTKPDPVATRPKQPTPAPRAKTPTPTPPKRHDNRATVGSETVFQSKVVRQLLEQKNYREALKVCTAILKRNSKHALTYRNMGIAYTGLGAITQACESYRRYLRFAPAARDRERVKALLTRCP